MADQTAQRQSAIRRAQSIRMARAAAKVMAKDLGAPFVASLLRDPPDWIENAEIGDVLRWIPKVGNDRVRRRLLGPLGIEECRPVAGKVRYRRLRPLVERERLAIVEALERL